MNVLEMTRNFEKIFPKTYNKHDQLDEKSVNSAPLTATRDALAERLQGVRDTASLLYNRMMKNMGYGEQETLKDIVEREAEEQQKQQEEKDIELTPCKHERALK